MPGGVAIRARRHLGGALGRGRGIGCHPSAKNRPVKTLAIASRGQAVQKRKRGLRIFIGECGHHGLHCLFAKRAGRKLLDPRRGRSRIVFGPAADGAVERPISIRPGGKRLRVGDGRRGIEFGPARDKKRNKDAFFFRLGQRLNERQNVTDIVRVNRLRELAESRVSAAAIEMRQPRFDFRDDIFRRIDRSRGIRFR